MLTPFLSALHQLEPEWQFVVYLSNRNVQVCGEGICTVVIKTRGWRRLWLELLGLDRRAIDDGADVMLNLLNSGSVAPRLPTITWQRNALYFDRRWLERQSLRVRAEAGVRRSLALLACRASEITVVPSHAMFDYVRDWALGKALRVEVVSHGVDAERFAGVYRPPDGRFVMGVMGHPAPHRGHAAALQVLSEVREAGIDAILHLTVPRYGNPAFQHTVDDVARTAKLRGLDDHIVFGGIAQDPVGWYQSLDLLLIPSECESFCFPLLEGFASGLPVLTSGIPVLREVSGDVALHGRTTAEMAAKVLEIYAEDETQRDGRRYRGMRLAENFTWGETALKVRSLVVQTVRTPSG